MEPGRDIIQAMVNRRDRLGFDFLMYVVQEDPNAPKPVGPVIEPAAGEALQVCVLVSQGDRQTDGQTSRQINIVCLLVLFWF
jgi:hypothetical protein